MEYQKIECNGYDLHLIKNKKFHTIELRIYFTENVSKEKITYYNALVDMMTDKTKKYDSREKLIKKCQELYSLYPRASSLRHGNILSTYFGMSIINSSYIDNNILENISLLKEIVLNPLVENGAFLENDLDIEKDILKNETNTVIEEPKLYSNTKLLSLLSSNENYALTGFSDIDLLNSMTGQSLYAFYKRMLNESKIDIYVSGNIHNEEEIIKAIKENFVFKKNHVELLDPRTYHHIKKDEPSFYKETKKYQQSKLALAYKAFDLGKDEYRYAFSVFNALVGGGTNSLLMQNVRERHSLCYYVGSYINNLDSLLVVNSGINKENSEKTLKLIKDSIQNVQQGKFSKKELKNAKTEYLISIENIIENNRNIIDYYYGMNLFGSDDIDTKIEKIKKITKEDIINVAKKIKLDTIFYLEGEL